MDFSSGDNGAALWCFGRVCAAAELCMVLRCDIRLHCPASECHDGQQYFFVPRIVWTRSSLSQRFTARLVKTITICIAHAAVNPLGNVHSRADHSLGEVHIRADHSLGRWYSHASSREHVRANLRARARARTHARTRTRAHTRSTHARAQPRRARTATFACLGLLSNSVTPLHRRHRFYKQRRQSSQDVWRMPQTKARLRPDADPMTSDGAPMTIR